MTRRGRGRLPGKHAERDPNALTHREAVFVLKLLESGNATQSYLDAGYSCTRESAGASAARLLTVVRVAEAWERAKSQRIASAAIDADEAFRRLAVIAGFDIGDLMDDKGALLPLKGLPADVRRVVKRVDKDGAVYLHDVMRALELIAETGGKIRKKVEADVNLQFDVAGALLRMESAYRAKLAARALTKGAK